MPTPIGGCGVLAASCTDGPAVIGNQLERAVQPAVHGVIGGFERKQQQPSTDCHTGVDQRFGGVE